MEIAVPSFECELCHKVFTRKSSRNRHVREQHLQPSLYNCKQCGLRFSKKYNLQVHTEHVHSTNRKQLKCSHCANIFTKLATLKNHVKLVHDNNCEKPISLNNELLVLDEEDDAQNFAESVLKELKQLQQDIQLGGMSPPKTLERQDVNGIEENSAKIISIKDNLYPLEHFTLLKAYTIKRMDGVRYLQCEFCCKEFKKTYNYLRHRRIHTKVRPFVCILCKKSFPTTTQLKTHCSMHKLDDKFGLFHKFYKCPKCSQGFNSIQQLDNHLSPISSCCDVTFQCPHCLKCYKTLKTLLRHRHSEKDNELEMLKTVLPRPLALWKEDKFSNDNIHFSECNFCGIQVNDGVLLKQHVKRHENLFKNQCGKCQCSYVSSTALMIHTKVHLSTTKQFKCHYCNKCFNTTQSCRRHMLTHLKQLLKTHDTLQDRNSTLVSYPTFIENEKRSKIETTTSIIKSTRKFKAKREEFKFKCLKCEKSFRFQAWLRKHFEYKHSENFPYECSTCFRKFRAKQSLKTHFLVHSKGRTKITCQVCGRQYASSKSLKLHIRIHTQEKPFKCDKCCMLFRTSGHLIQHRKANHKE